jgi:hypothetical protein
VVNHYYCNYQLKEIVFLTKANHNNLPISKINYLSVILSVQYYKATNDRVALS